MLRLIEGPPGTGKSTFAFDEIRRRIGEGASVILMVPEQFSLETERYYYEKLSFIEQKHLSVFSFLRLSEEIGKICGKGGGIYATESDKLIAMRRTLKEIAPKLRYYKSSGYLDFLQRMVRFSDELYQSDVAPSILLEQAQKENHALGDKLWDLSLIFESYRTILLKRYKDEAMRLIQAAKTARETSFFAGKIFYFDEFKSFTADQKQLLELMLEQSKEVTVTLCNDPKEKESGLFDVVRETKRQLKALAFQHGVTVKPDIRLTENHRFRRLGLLAFSNSVFRYRSFEAERENQSVSAVCFSEPYGECEYLAAKIVSLLRDEGYRYQDIAVLGRDLTEYGPMLRAAFDRQRIPYFSGEETSIGDYPLVRFIAHLLPRHQTYPERECWLNALKCRLLPFSDEEISAFEEYSYVWNIEGEGFFSPFVRPIAGYQSKEKPQDRKKRLWAENVRKRLMSLHEALWDRIQEEQSISRGIYRFLLEEGIEETVQKRIRSLFDFGEYARSRQEGEVWDGVIRLLDGLLDFPGEGETLNRRALTEYRELYLLGANGICPKAPPQTIDSVQIGTVDQVRLRDKKVVMLFGVNDRLLPYVSEPGGIFTEAEKRTLLDQGISFGKTAEESLIEERFVTYLAVSAPSEQLIMTYSLQDTAGKDRRPSVLIRDVIKLFSQSAVHSEKEISPLFYCTDPLNGFYRYAREKNRPGREVFSASLREVLQQYPSMEKRLSALSALEKRAFFLSDETVIQRLFAGKAPRKLILVRGERKQKRYRLEKTSVQKGQIRLSPTQIENYYACPFLYFCRYGLKLKPKQRAVLDPLSRGNVIHALLFALLRKENIFEAEEKTVKAVIQRELDRYYDDVIGKEKSDRFAFYYDNIGDTVYQIYEALKEEFAQSQFHIEGLEEMIQKGGRIEPFTVEEEKNLISVFGKIDRLDCFTDPKGNTYARVIDYKSGEKKFDLSSVAGGFHLQMLLYLFAIKRNPNGPLAHLRPAGILYMPAKNPKALLPRDATDEDTKALQKKSFVMSGLLLDDYTVLTAMEKDLAGHFLPVSQGKSSMKGNYLLTEARMERLEAKVEELVRKMGRGLVAGEIAPMPKGEAQRLPCRYCGYRTLCGREEKDPFLLPEKAPEDWLEEEKT